MDITELIYEEVIQTPQKKTDWAYYNCASLISKKRGEQTYSKDNPEKGGRNGRRKKEVHKT